MRKILFFVFILFLFLFSTAITQAANCTVTAVPGPDPVAGKAGILTSHTHNANIFIKSDGLFTTDPKGYIISLGIPKKPNILYNDDDHVYDYSTWPVTNSDYRAKSNGGSDLWNVGVEILCTANNCADQTLEIPNMDGVGESRDTYDPNSYDSYMGYPFLPGTYTVTVYSVAAQDRNTPVCTGSFTVDPSTLDLGYDHCKIDIQNSSDTMTVGNHLSIIPHIWPAAGKGNGDTVSVSLVSLDASHQYLRQDVHVGDINNKPYDVGIPPLVQSYYVALWWGGGPGGAWADQRECVHGPFYIDKVGGHGGDINPSAGESCPICGPNTQYLGINSDLKAKCKDNNPDSSTFGTPIDPTSIITCPPNSVCTHMVDYGCIPMSTADGSDNINPPPPFCSQFSTDGYKCANINIGLTSLGIPLPTEPGGLLSALLGIVLSIAGGISIILIMISGYRMMISQGDPEKIKDAREQLTAAIIGLLFIIFSLVILQLIGVSILNLPGFNQ
jgi:hypothetical protein